MKNPKNVRPSLESPVTVATDASKRAVGASLVQEIAAEHGFKEKVLIYAASRSFNHAETRYCTIRREVRGVIFAVQKLTRFSVENDSMIKTEYRPLIVLFKKPLLSKEKEDLRDLVAQLSEYSFYVKYPPGASNQFTDWLLRNCVEEIYNCHDHRLNDEKSIEGGNRKQFVTAHDRRSLLFS